MMKNLKKSENITKSKEIEKQIEKQIEVINRKLRVIRVLKMNLYALIGTSTAVSLVLFIVFTKYENGKSLFDKINENTFYLIIGVATIVISFTEAYANSLENALSRKLKNKNYTSGT